MEARQLKKTTTQCTSCVILLLIRNETSRLNEIYLDEKYNKINSVFLR